MDEMEATINPQPKVIKWLGSKPTTCDICHKPFTDTMLDARTTSGRWGLLCPDCHKDYGVGIGIGRGQEYRLRSGEWIKVAG